jgi:outer membrane protein OmpA-like peptidoglycan-associated protein
MNNNLNTPSFFNSEDNNIYALSIADAMAGMMLILLMAFLAIFLQMNALPNKSKEIAALKEQLKKSEGRNKSEAQKYFSMKKEIYNSLLNEFSDDLKKWNARIDENTLAFILENSNNGFKAGSAEIPNELIVMLNQFVPRYIRIISPYREHINEIRIEGHTSSEWSDNIAECIDNSDACKQTAYIKNMELSQDRAMSVLNNILLMNNIENKVWVRAKLTANGLSSSHLLCGAEKKLCVDSSLEQENREASRRVEFSIRTDAETKITEILNSKISK